MLEAQMQQPGELWWPLQAWPRFLFPFVSDFLLHN